MSTSIFEEFFQRLFIRLSFISEPLLPLFLSYFLNKQLRRWKDEGLITGYKAGAERVQKFHYKIAIDLDLTPDQAKKLINKSVNRVSKGVRRWVYG